MLVDMIDAGKISGAQAKLLIADMMAGKDPKTAAKEKGLEQLSDTGELASMVGEVLNLNPQAIEDFKNGKDRAVGFLVGQVMKKSHGKANPGMVSELEREELARR